MEKNYSEQPVLCNETAYIDDEIKLTKIWHWDNIVSVYEEEDAGFCRALLSGMYINGGGKSTFVSYDGKRLTDLTFDYMGDYENEMMMVGVGDYENGYINKDCQLTIPLKYEHAGDFCNGYAAVHDGNEWLFVDKQGNEIRLENKYEQLGNFSDGLARVSAFCVWREGLAYHSDYYDDAGIWGYVDKNGKEVISPQYIYAFDFQNDRAIVAKGKWTKNKKWDNECRQGAYWTEYELWGVIDKNGKEIIPCIYDEIKPFMNDDHSICEDYYQVHVGGWKNGKWAIADRNGNFVTEPIFNHYSYDYSNGLFTYENRNSLEDLPDGIYDLNENKILFEPQFDDVTFLDDGNILVEVSDEESGCKIEKIIDKTGKEIFKSDYTSIYTWKKPYIAIKEKDNYTIWDLIDENGNILESIEFKEKISYWDNDVNFETRTYKFSENEKFGLKNFNGEIIIPAKFKDISSCYENKNLYYFKTDDDLMGLMKADGTVVIQPKFENISLLKNHKIICNGNNGVEVFEYEKP